MFYYQTQEYFCLSVNLFIYAEDVKVKTKAFISFLNNHAKQTALTVIDSCIPALVVAQNVNAAICGAQQVSLKT